MSEQDHKIGEHLAELLGDEGADQLRKLLGKIGGKITPEQGAKLDELVNKEAAILHEALSLLIHGMRGRLIVNLAEIGAQFNNRLLYTELSRLSTMALLNVWYETMQSCHVVKDKSDATALMRRIMEDDEW
jgi:hypothetical protein